MTDEELYNLFRRFGEIFSAKVIKRQNNPATKCFGFVNFFVREAQKEAIRASGKDLSLQGSIIECEKSSNNTVVYVGNIYRYYIAYKRAIDVLDDDPRMDEEL